MGNQQDPPKGTTEPKPEPEITNAQVKAHPLFQNLTQQLSELQSWKEQQEDARKKAELDSETKKLEEAKQYETATQKKVDAAVTAAKKEAKTEFDAELKRRDAKIELVRMGFKNETFLKGALAEYDGKQETAEFAKAVFEDDANKPFLDAASSKPKPPPDPNAPPSGTMATLSPDQLKEMRNSDDPKERQKAHTYVAEQWVKTGATGLE